MKLETLLKKSTGILLYILLTLSYSLNAQRQTNPIISPEILKDNSVIFRLLAPEADTVKLGGTMNADYSELEMKKNKSKP